MQYSWIQVRVLTYFYISVCIEPAEKQKRQISGCVEDALSQLTLRQIHAD